MRLKEEPTGNYGIWTLDGWPGKAQEVFQREARLSGLELRARESMVFRGPVLPESKGSKTSLAARRPLANLGRLAVK